MGTGTKGVAEASTLMVAVMMVGAVQARAVQLQARVYKVTTTVLSLLALEGQSTKVVVIRTVMVTSAAM